MVKNPGSHGDPTGWKQDRMSDADRKLLFCFGIHIVQRDAEEGPLADAFGMITPEHGHLAAPKYVFTAKITAVKKILQQLIRHYIIDVRTKVSGFAAQIADAKRRHRTGKGPQPHLLQRLLKQARPL